MGCFSSKSELEHELRLCISIDDTYGIEELLENTKINVNLINKEDGHTALTFAASRNERDQKKGANLVRILLAAKSVTVPGAQNLFGYTALIYACRDGNLEMVKLLLDTPLPHIQEIADDGTTALLQATKNNNVKIAKLLLERIEKQHGVYEPPQNKVAYDCTGSAVWVNSDKSNSELNPITVANPVDVATAAACAVSNAEYLLA